MIIHLKIKPPINMVLGLSETPHGVNLDTEITPGTNLSSLFKQLARTYPGFQRLTSPENDIFKAMLIVVDGQVVLAANVDQITLQDQSTVSFIMRYSGG